MIALITLDEQGTSHHTSKYGVVKIPKVLVHLIIKVLFLSSHLKTIAYSLTITFNQLSSSTHL